MRPIEDLGDKGFGTYLPQHSNHFLLEIKSTKLGEEELQGSTMSVESVTLDLINGLGTLTLREFVDVDNGVTDIVEKLDFGEMHLILLTHGGDERVLRFYNINFSVHKFTMDYNTSDISKHHLDFSFESWDQAE